MNNIPFFPVLVSIGSYFKVKNLKRLALLCFLLCPPRGACLPAGFSPLALFPLEGAIPRTPDTSLSIPEGRYGFTLFSAAGFFYGQGEEMVYWDSSRERLLSQLLWDLKPLYYVETGLEFSRSRPWEEPGFLTKLTVQLGFPLASGIMEDRDWRDPKEDFLTNYSRHDAWLDGMFSIDIRGGISIPLTSRLLFKAYLGFSTLYFKWTGRDGYYQYAEENDPWNDALEKHAITGTGIIYSQHWAALFPAVSLGSSFLKRFSWELGCAASPLIYGAARDDHLLRDLEFYDTFSSFSFFQGDIMDLLDGLFLECRGNFGFALNPALTLGISAAWRTARSQKTEAAYRPTGTKQDGNYKQTNPGGAAYSFVEAGLSLKVRL